METRKGFKLLNPYGATIGRSTDGKEGGETIYPLPGPGEKWGAWFQHPNPSLPDGNDCGPGGWHAMKNLDARYAPSDWYPWFAECGNILGESSDKMRCTRIRLRRIPVKVFWRIIRLGWCKDANLVRANLVRANLVRANLKWANLEGANLYGANLSGANLVRANLEGANLSGANLEGANLKWANLEGANLYGANLSGANLEGANLSGANLTGADLYGATCPGPTWKT